MPYDYRHLLPEIEHKAFAKAVRRNGFSSGNVYSDAQASTYVRAFQETSCNGFTFKPGELQDADLKPYRKSGMPLGVERAIREHCRTSGGCLYMIRHWTGPKHNKQRVLHGWILMDWHQNECLYRTYANSRKTESIMEFALAEIRCWARWYNAVRARHAYERTLERIAPHLTPFIN